VHYSGPCVVRRGKQIGAWPYDGAMRPVNRLLVIALLVICGSGAAAKPRAPAPVLLFGESAADDATLRRLVLTPAGGKNARVVVLVTEGTDQRTLAESQRWRRAGTAHVANMTLQFKKHVPRLLEIADVVWIADAPAADVVRRIKEFGALAHLRRAQQRGMRIAAHGRAGAALAAWFIDAAGKTRPGLGLCGNILVDAQVKRAGALRVLLDAVVARPKAIGMRVEPSAVLLIDEHAIEIAGTGRVTVVDARKANIRPAAEGRRITGVCVHDLAAGMKLVLGAPRAVR